MKVGEEAEEEAKEDAEVAEEDEKEEEQTSSSSSSLHLLLLSSILLLQPHLRYIPSPSLSSSSLSPHSRRKGWSRACHLPLQHSLTPHSPSNHKILSPIFSAGAML